MLIAKALHRSSYVCFCVKTTGEITRGVYFVLKDFILFVLYVFLFKISLVKLPAGYILLGFTLFVLCVILFEKSPVNRRILPAGIFVSKDGALLGCVIYGLT